MPQGIWRPDPPLPPTGPKFVPVQGGSQPPGIARQLAATLAIIVAAWPTDGQPAPLQPSQTRAAQIAPLTLTYGQQPPKNGPLGGSSNVSYSRAIHAWWPADGEPRPTRQQLVGVQIAPLTLKYGDPPPITGPIPGDDCPSFYHTIAQWPAPWWNAQSAAPSAAWNFPVNNPPPRRPYPIEAVARQWELSWLAQSASPSASWNVPVVANYVPPGIRQSHIGASWSIDPTTVITITEGASLLQAPGDQPPVQGPLAASQLRLLIGTWDPGPWPAQSEAEGAAWNFVPPVVSVPTPRVPYPIGAVLAWTPPWTAAQSAQPTAAWNVPAPSVPPPYRPYPIGIVLSAQPPWVGPPRPVTVAPLTLRYGSQPPPGPAFAQAVAIAIAQQWPAVWWEAQSAAPVAPLTLTYGQQPSVIGVRVPPAALLPWYPDWGTQRYPPVAAELAALFSVISQPGINHIAFDASITVAVFNSLVTSTVTDSLTTKSVFDG